MSESFMCYQRLPKSRRECSSASKGTFSSDPLSEFTSLDPMTIRLARLLGTLAVAFIAASLLAGANLSAASAQTTSPLPKPEPFRYVVDNAAVIDSATSDRMEKTLRALKDSADIEFAVVTVKTTGDQDIFDYSLAVARGWGIGSSEGEKNGLLLLVVVDDHKNFMQVSRHLEGYPPAALVEGVM